MFTGLFTPTNIAELVAFVAALVFLNKNSGICQVFKLILLITLLAEFTGWILAWKLYRPNGWVFNSLLGINSSFIVFILFQRLNYKYKDKVLIAIISLIIISTLVTLVFLDGITIYNRLMEITIDLGLAILCCIVLYQMLLTEKNRSFYAFEYFWLVNGVLVYSLGSAVLYVSHPYLGVYQQESGIQLAQYINDTLNIILYASYIIAFICRWKHNKS
ncbi:MAG: hypothetical protein EOO88_42245 [Pedobacter sp.]|nr:MAG: hypothetical protein EOO88_42245 [Pedobacter sp.]